MQTAAWEQELMSFSLPPGPRTANKYGRSWMELNTSPSSSDSTHTKLLGLKLSRKPQNTKCQLLLAVSLLWTQDKAEMALLKLVFLGWSHDKTWGVSGKKIIKPSFQIWKTVRSVGMGFSEVYEKGMFTPILFSQQALFYKTIRHGDAKPGSETRQWCWKPANYRWIDTQLSLAFKDLCGLTPADNYHLSPPLQLPSFDSVQLSWHLPCPALCQETRKALETDTRMGKTQAIPLRGRMLGVSQEGAMLPKQEKEEADAG